MSDDDHGAFGPEMPSGSDGPATGPQDSQGPPPFPGPVDDFAAWFFSDWGRPSWLQDGEATPQPLSRTLSNDSMSSPTPSPWGYTDTLSVYHAYRWSGVTVSDIYATTNESPPFGPGNPGRRILIDDVLHILHNPGPAGRWRRGAAWHRVRHIRGMRDRILEQPDNCWMHWILNDHMLWLTLVHEFMDMKALAGLRSSCRQAYHKWVVNDRTLVRRWLQHALKTFILYTHCQQSGLGSVYGEKPRISGSPG